ncbi:MAG: hypothetical protein AB8G05_23670 [Oligoflexales bacterium]
MLRAWAPPRSFDFPTIISFLEKLGKFAKDYSALSLTHKSGGVFPIRHYLSSDGEHKENSFEVMLMNLGNTEGTSRDISLPDIVSLEVMEHKSVVQVSVYSPENFAVNTQRDLTKYLYLWEFDGHSIEAPTFRTILMGDKETTLDLTIFNPDRSEQKTYSFIIMP